MYRWFSRLLRWCRPWLRWLLLWLQRPVRRRWVRTSGQTIPLGRIFAPPKPKWVRQEVIRSKALMPDAGCRTIAHTFNRQWQSRKQMTVSKTYVADTCWKEQYRILQARRQLKHRVPRPMPRNRVWGCDLLTKTDQHGTPHLALAIVDHASRACLRLQALSDKSSMRLWQELLQAVQCYGRPHYLRTDNEAVFVSRLFRFGLWLLGIRQQRIQPGCPWQNGRVERFIGTVKRALAMRGQSKFQRGIARHPHLVQPRAAARSLAGPDARRSLGRDRYICGEAWLGTADYGVTGEARGGCPARSVRAAITKES